MIELVFVFVLLLVASFAGVLEMTPDSRVLTREHDRGWWPARRTP